MTFEERMNAAIEALNTIKTLGKQVEEGLISESEFVLDCMVQQNISNCAVVLGVKQHAQECQTLWQDLLQ